MISYFINNINLISLTKALSISTVGSNNCLHLVARLSPNFWNFKNYDFIFFDTSTINHPIKPKSWSWLLSVNLIKCEKDFLTKSNERQHSSLNFVNDQKIIYGLIVPSIKKNRTKLSLQLLSNRIYPDRAKHHQHQHHPASVSVYPSYQSLSIFWSLGHRKKSSSSLSSSRGKKVKFWLDWVCKSSHWFDFLAL